MSLEMSQKEIEGITILGLHGRLVAGADVAELRSRFDALLAQRIINIILDLANVQYIDSSGLGALVIGHSQAKKAGGALKLLNVSKRSAQLLILTKLSTVFEIFDDEPAALNSFFPDREVKGFDILDFVKEAQSDSQHLGAENSEKTAEGES